MKYRFQDSSVAIDRTPDENLETVMSIRLESHDQFSQLANNNTGNLIKFLQQNEFQVTKLKQEAKDWAILWTEQRCQTCK